MDSDGKKKAQSKIASKKKFVRSSESNKEKGSVVAMIENSTKHEIT